MRHADSRALRRMAGLVLVVAAAMPLLCACGKREAAPSAPGYYTGPMRGKGMARGNADAAPAAARPGRP